MQRKQGLVKSSKEPIVRDPVSGKLTTVRTLNFSEAVIAARKNKNPWDVIDMLVKEWAERSPNEVSAFKVQIDDYRNTRQDRRFARTHNRDQDRRMIMVMPETLHNMIRAIFKKDELEMNRDFFRKFVKKYPGFQIPEKI